MTALGLGLLIGTVRERLHKPVQTMAGIRTHTLVAILGSVSFSLGMTGEVSILVSFVLAGLAMHNSILASSITVVVAGILFAQEPLRRFGRELIREDELKDVLLLAAAALVVLLVSGVYLRQIDVHVPPKVDTATSAFKISHALVIAATIGLVMLVAVSTVGW